MEYLKGIEEKLEWMKSNDVFSISFQAGKFCEERFVDLRYSIDGFEERLTLTVDDVEVLGVWDKKLFLEKLEEIEKDLF